MRFGLNALVLLAAGLIPIFPAAGQRGGTTLLTGTVVGFHGEPIINAVVTLHESAETTVNAKTDEAGFFRLQAPGQPRYELDVETTDHRHAEVVVVQPGAAIRIVVQPAEAGAVMEFADKPDFTVAGVTDWTAVGGHGSDATLRTSEDLARQTAALKSAVTAVHSVGDSADAHRRAGEAAERRGDPLGAVHEEERAAALDPTEENYFTWGSELLVHRAIWQAAEVFSKGAKLHPESQRLQTGWGAALFAGAKYDEASARLCAASDLNPANRETYLFLGKLGLGSPLPEVCVSEKLARFIRLYPDDAEANYYEAMMLLKADPTANRRRAAELLQKAVALKPGFADGYLQLGILASVGRDNAGAQADFERAIAADPFQAEAHYRLAVVYDRTGHAELAKAEFARHEALVKQQADAVEQERRQVKQFLVVLGESAAVKAAR